MKLFSARNHFPVEGRTILITGGSRGTGRSAGQQLAAKGANVIIVARDVERLKNAIEFISKSAKNPKIQRFHHISADLTNPTESIRIVSEATSFNNGQPPDIVWNCAGSTYPHLFIDTPIDQFRKVMDDSYFTSVYMSHAILNAWLRDASSPTAEPRHLIFTASFLSFFPVTGYASYSPSKAALRCLSDTLSQEMNLYANTPTNVRVHTVFPATIFTESFEEEQKVKADVTKMIEEGDEGQTPDEVARLCIEGLERGEELVTTTFLTRIAMAGMLGGSLRNGWALLDTLLSWLMSIVTVFIRLDLDRKVRRWGRENGSSGMKKQK